MELKCEQCGKPFLAGRRHRFCSYACGQIAALKEMQRPDVLKAYEEAMQKRNYAKLRVQR